MSQFLYLMELTIFKTLFTDAPRLHPIVYVCFPMRSHERDHVWAELQSAESAMKLQHESHTPAAGESIVHYLFKMYQIIWGAPQYCYTTNDHDIETWKTYIVSIKHKWQYNPNNPGKMFSHVLFSSSSGCLFTRNWVVDSHCSFFVHYLCADSPHLPTLVF